ncbi:MAG: hypothetical protein M5U28_30435 [Sandaracinaceae bacterium]|nr:hypothetical protein [Sandaracinaceae bacterium]
MAWPPSGSWGGGSHDFEVPAPRTSFAGPLTVTTDERGEVPGYAECESTSWAVGSTARVELRPDRGLWTVRVSDERVVRLTRAVEGWLPSAELELVGAGEADAIFTSDSGEERRARFEVVEPAYLEWELFLIQGNDDLYRPVTLSVDALGLFAGGHGARVGVMLFGEDGERLCGHPPLEIESPSSALEVVSEGAYANAVTRVRASSAAGAETLTLRTGALDTQISLVTVDLAGLARVMVTDFGWGIGRSDVVCEPRYLAIDPVAFTEDGLRIHDAPFELRGEEIFEACPRVVPLELDSEGGLFRTNPICSPPPFVVTFGVVGRDDLAEAYATRVHDPAAEGCL